MSAPVVIVGSLNADLFVEVAALPRPGETVRGSDLTVRPGGKGANQAAAAGLLGADVTMIGAVGADDHGRLLLSAAESAGVRTARIRSVDVATGTAMITVDGAGENTIIISPGANARLSVDDARAGIDDRTAVVGLCLEIEAETVAAAVARAREVGATVVLNLSPYRRVDPEVLAGVGRAAGQRDRARAAGRRLRRAGRGDGSADGRRQTGDRGDAGRRRRRHPRRRRRRQSTGHLTGGLGGRHHRLRRRLRGRADQSAGGRRRGGSTRSRRRSGWGRTPRPARARSRPTRPRSSCPTGHAE